MTYQAVVSKISVSPHPNAHSLQLGYVKGFRVVVGLDTKDGDLILYFPTDGQLSKEFADANDLVAKYDDNRVKIGGGYFDDKRRVKSQNFRSVKSEGFVMPLESVAFTGYDISLLKDGDMFDTLNKVPICNKFFTKATLAAIGSKKKTKTYADFPEHKETAQFRFVEIPNGALVHISEKEHGTSVRYGNVLVNRELNLFNRVKNFFTGKGFAKVASEYEYVLGTRRAVLPKASEQAYGGGFYGNGDPYTLASMKAYGKLKEGEILYGEIVGYLNTGAALFAQGTEKLKDVAKTYGNRMVFSYGCVEGTAKFKIYRITQNGRDLTWFEIKERADQLGIETVTNYKSLVFDGDRDSLNSTVEGFLEGPSALDERHIREGVCLRIESEHGIRIVKSKSWTFGTLEGYIKDNDNEVDIEEVA